MDLILEDGILANDRTLLQAEFSVARYKEKTETVGGLADAAIKGQQRKIWHRLAGGQGAGEMDRVQGAHRFRWERPPRAR